jgi:hypothetical protein
MRPMAHLLTHENERCRGERPLARVRFTISISGRPAGRPYNIDIFGTVTTALHTAHIPSRGTP